MMWRKHFHKDESGIALTEGLIVFPLMLLSIVACVEFSYGMFQWNTAAKAMQIGARKLIVSDPITPIYEFPEDVENGGTVVDPNTERDSSCGPGQAAACDADGMARLLVDMQAINSNITAENLIVTYQHNGLGYEGRPGGPVFTVRMELTNLPLDLPFIGAFLDIANITYPPFPVSVTSEDLNTNSGT
jgi:Flp pilus assembly protein TadG